MSSRRLRKSLNLGRIATDKDLEPDESDRGIDNHIPFVNRLSAWWKRMRGNRFLDTSTDAQREVLKRNLEPVVEIYNQLLLPTGIPAPSSRSRAASTSTAATTAVPDSPPIWRNTSKRAWPDGA